MRRANWKLDCVSLTECLKLLYMRVKQISGDLIRNLPAPVLKDTEAMYL